MITLLQEHLDDSSSREPQAAHDHITRVPSSWLIHGYPACKVFLFSATDSLPLSTCHSWDQWASTVTFEHLSPQNVADDIPMKQSGDPLSLLSRGKQGILESQSISPGSVDFSKTSRQHTCSDTLVFLVNLIASWFASHLYTPWARQLSGPGPEPYARSKVK
jgi:hypothetical protein